MRTRTIEARRSEREVVLACRLDELDRRGAPRLLAAVEATDLRDATAVRLDLGRVRHADTALVAVLLLLQRSLSRAHRTFTVGPVSPAVDAVLSLHSTAVGW